MAEDLQLPSDLLDDGFFHDIFVECSGSVAAGSKGEKGGDLASLVRRMGMVRSLLQDDGEAWNLHAEPAGRGAIGSELAGAELRRRSKQERGLLNQPPGNPLGPLLALHQLQAARILHLKQQQLLQKQLHAAWEETQSKAKRGLPSSCRTPFSLHHQPHPGSGTRALFLCHSGSRKESAGTGVFLPRTTGNKPEQQKKPGILLLAGHRPTSRLDVRSLASSSPKSIYEKNKPCEEPKAWPACSHCDLPS